MKEPLISVVIPVYNVEKYLKQCLESVINQTYKNLEIICIDDCSQDSSYEILKEYAQRDSRIRIKKNSQNLGLGLSRNEGIKLAAGEYIHFLDSDDWMELDAYEILSQYFESNVDAISFVYILHDVITKKTFRIGYPKDNYLYRKLNLYNEPEYMQYFNSSAWLKIYRREFIMTNNLFFNDHGCFEDVEYAMNIALKAENIIFIENTLLNYRYNRKNSLLSRKNYHINDLIKDVQWATNNTQDLPYNVRSAILNFAYEFLIANSLDAYYVFIMPYKKMKKCFEENIDANILEDTGIYDNTLVSTPYKKAIKYNHLQFFVLYNVQRYIRTHFPALNKLYIKIKRKLLNAY